LSTLRYGCNWVLLALTAQALGQPFVSALYGSTATVNVLLEMGVVIKQSSLKFWAVPGVVHMMNAASTQRPFALAFDVRRRRSLHAKVVLMKRLGTLFSHQMVLWPTIRGALDVDARAPEWKAFLRSAAVEVIHGDDAQPPGGAAADQIDCAGLEAACVDYLASYLSIDTSRGKVLRPLSPCLKLMHPHVLTEVMLRLFNVRVANISVRNLHVLMQHNASHGPVRAVLRAVVDELNRHQRLRGTYCAYGRACPVALSCALVQSVCRTLAACHHAPFRVQTHLALMNSLWARTV
jgi:hypothetical protein